MVPPTATAATCEEKLKATQKKFQNFDSELTQLVSGLKSNLKKESDESPILDDEKLILDDIEPLEASPAQSEPIHSVVDEPVEQRADESHSQSNRHRPLADIIVDLNEIRPHDEYPPQCIMDEQSGLKITLNFTKDRPRPDVAVLVITTTNHNKLPIKNFQFEASVPKVCAFIFLFQ